MKTEQETRDRANELFKALPIEYKYVNGDMSGYTNFLNVLNRLTLIEQVVIAQHFIAGNDTLGGSDLSRALTRILIHQAEGEE